MHNAATFPNRRPEVHPPKFVVRSVVIAILLLIGFIVGRKLWEGVEHRQKLKALQQYKADHDRRMAKIDLLVLQNSQFQEPEVRTKWRKVGSDLSAEVNVSEVRLNEIYDGQIPDLNQRDFAAYRVVLADEKAFLDTLDRATFVEDKEGTMQILPKDVSDQFWLQYGRFEKDIKALSDVEKEFRPAITKEREAGRGK